MNGGDIVYVRGHTGTDRDRYHTDKDCSRLSIIEDPIPKRKRTLAGFREECDECANGPPSNTDQDHSYHETLQETDSAKIEAHTPRGE